MSYSKTTKPYYESKGTGETIVFVHGFSLDHSMWDYQVKLFSKDFRTLTYDMRGFGKSPLPIEEYSHHEDLNNLLDELNIPNAHIVGLSLGGEISIDFAITFPQRVITLSLLSSSLGGFPEKEDWDVKAREMGVEQGKINWLNHKVFDFTNRNSSVKDMLKPIIDDYSGWHWINSDPNNRLREEAYNRIGEIKSKTLIMVGEHDLQYFHHIANYINLSISGSTLLEVEKAGHMINMEVPDFVNDKLMGHINNG